MMTGLRHLAEELDRAGNEGCVAAMIARDAEPLPDIDDPAFGRMFDRFAGARLVLLGEASHGTSEFYRARAAITRRLIEEHGFNMVAIEADWPDAATIDRHVRHKPTRADGEPPFTRFPTWMWRNAEFDAFVRWLRRHNEGLTPEARVSFHGLGCCQSNANRSPHAAFRSLSTTP
jgi:erythromycin esterase-like protein